MSEAWRHFSALGYNRAGENLCRQIGKTEGQAAGQKVWWGVLQRGYWVMSGRWDIELRCQFFLS